MSGSSEPAELARCIPHTARIARVPHGARDLRRALEDESPEREDP